MTDPWQFDILPGPGPGWLGDRMPFDQWKRRDFVALLGGVAAWPMGARAQQPALPVIGFLNQGSQKTDGNFATIFSKALSQLGYLEGQNVAIEYRWAEGQYDRLPELATELVRRNVSVIATAYAAATLAAKAATSAIPIVFLTGTDPVRSGLVSSLNRPGGNVTGVAIFNVLTGAKRLGLLRDLLPGTDTFAVLMNPANPLVSEPFLQDVQTAARARGLRIVVLPASTDREIDNAFATLVDQRIGALMVATDAFLTSRQDHILALTARHAIPAIYDRREIVVAGGLMYYGTDFADTYRQQGAYVGRILKGEKPADIPVQHPTKFLFVLNLATAKTLGLTIPPDVLSIADEVIE